MSQEWFEIFENLVSIVATAEPWNRSRSQSYTLKHSLSKIKKFDASHVYYGSRSDQWRSVTTVLMSPMVFIVILGNGFVRREVLMFQFLSGLTMFFLIWFWVAKRSPNSRQQTSPASWLVENQILYFFQKFAPFRARRVPRHHRAVRRHRRGLRRRSGPGKDARRRRAEPAQDVLEAARVRAAADSGRLFLSVCVVMNETWIFFFTERNYRENGRAGQAEDRVSVSAADRVRAAGGCGQFLPESVGE